MSTLKYPYKTFCKFPYLDKISLSTEEDKGAEFNYKYLKSSFRIFTKEVF